jgi:glycosyltransferase involved in cell wall biosynthesis
MKPSILFIVPAEYEALKIKGVEGMVLERDEGGYFGKVITIHPVCSKTRSIILNKVHEIYEVGLDLIPGSARLKFLKYLQCPIHFFRVIWGTVRFLKIYHIDLIRANDSYWMGLFGYICSRICKIPFCVSIHADSDKRIELDSDSVGTVLGSNKLGKRLERFILSRADMVLPIRETLRVKAVANGADAKKTRVIPHGIDLSPFNLPPTHDIRKIFKIDPTLRIISFVGRISKENYVDDVLEIARKLGLQRKDFIIVLAGGGGEEDRIRKEIKADPFLAEHVLPVGFQPRNVCLDLRRASEVSLCLMAGFSLIEACAAAHPIISYDVEWHSELVKNTETGFLIEEHNMDGVVNALNWLLEHPIEGDAMGQNAKSLAFERHDLIKTSAVKISCYLEMLSEGAVN